MLRFWKKKASPVRLELPDEGELIAYLDGQLDRGRHAQIERLLEQSWELRVRLTAVERDVETYVEATSYRTPSEIPPFERIWKGGPVSASSPHMKPAIKGPSTLLAFVNGLSARFGFLSAKFAVVVAASILSIFFLVRLSSVSPVSAHELLLRTEQAEAHRARQFLQPVIYQKLQVRRSPSPPLREQSVRWEVWWDPENDRCRQRVEDELGHRWVDGEAEINSVGNPSDHVPSLPPIVAELKQVFEKNRMDVRRPLSPASFQSWRKSTQSKSEKVVEAVLPEGDLAFRIQTEVTGPSSLNDIVRADFTVRKKDWHPLRQLCQVQNGTESISYELNEIAYNVLALKTLPPSVFPDHLQGPLPRTVAPHLATGPSGPASTETQLALTEIEALYAVHRVGGCLGEPVEILKVSHDRVEVRGVVATTGRREELLAALRGIPLLTAKLRTIQEAVAETSSSSASEDEDQEGKTAAVVVETNRLPIQTELEQYFRKLTGNGSPEPRPGQAKAVDVHQKVAEFSDEATSLARSLLAEAWALRRLAERFAGSSAERLRPQSLWLLEVMLRDHLAGFEAHSSQVRSLVEPVLIPLSEHLGSVKSQLKSSNLGSTEPEEHAWQKATLEVFREAEQVHGYVLSLFAGATPSSSAELDQGSSGPMVSELLSALSRLEGQAETVQARVALAFSERSTVASHDRAK